MNNQLLTIRIWTKAILLLLLGILLMTLLLLNMNAVIEPRLHLLFKQYERPNLLLVLLVTSFISLMAGLLIRTIAKTLRELREVRIRSRTAGLEREIAELKRTAPPTAPTTAPPGSEHGRADAPTQTFTIVTGGQGDQDDANRTPIHGRRTGPAAPVAGSGPGKQPG